jgi:hypothetical protein
MKKLKSTLMSIKEMLHSIKVITIKNKYGFQL